MGRISILLAATSLLVLGSYASAKEIRQVAPGITMVPGSAKPRQVKNTAPVKVETSRIEPTTYGPKVAPEYPLEAKVDEPKPGTSPVNITAQAKPNAGAVPAERPVAASTRALPTSPVSEQKVAEAPGEQIRNPQTANAARTSRELKVGDRIPDDVKLYPAQAVRVGERVPDNVQLYDLPRTALR